MTARQIADYSHEETAYSSHVLGDSIPYSEAKSLRPIPLSDEGKKCSPADIAREVMGGVPPEEFEKLPKDASTNLDHYLYGHPRISTPAREYARPPLKGAKSRK